MVWYMRVEICGFYGFGNAGDEAILQSIIDNIGRQHEYIISTSLPYNHWKSYTSASGMNYEIRSHDDLRTDIDVYILGGGELNWGYGWRQCLSMFANDKVRCMNYGVGYNRKWYYSNRLHKLYYEFLKNFNAITVRDEVSFGLLQEIGLDNVTLAFDPTITLKDEKFDNCPIGKIAVFPRYEDAGIDSNAMQIEWLVSKLKNVARDVVLVACGPKNIEGYPVDMVLCEKLYRRLNGSHIIEISPFEPRKMKYLISQCKMIYSGGRYHPIVFAISHNVHFKLSPAANSYPKNQSILDMFQKFGRDGLMKLANKNNETFLEMMKK